MDELKSVKNTKAENPPNATIPDEERTIVCNRKMFALLALTAVVGIGSWVGIDLASSPSTSQPAPPTSPPTSEKQLVLYDQQADNIVMSLEGLPYISLNEISMWNAATVSHVNSYFNENVVLSIQNMQTRIVAENRIEDGSVEMTYAQQFTFKSDKIYTANELARQPFETIPKKSYLTSLRNISNAFMNIDIVVDILDGTFSAVNNLQMAIGGFVYEFDREDWKNLTAVHIKKYFNTHNANLGVIVSEVLIEILNVERKANWIIVTYQHPEMGFRAKDAELSAEEIALLPFGDNGNGRADYIQSLETLVAFQNIKSIEAIVVSNNPSIAPSSLRF